MNALITAYTLMEYSENLEQLYLRSNKRILKKSSYKLFIKAFGELSINDLLNDAIESIKKFYGFDEISLGLIVDALIKNGNLDKAQEIIYTSNKANTISYTTLLKGLCNNNLLDSAMELLVIMKKNPKTFPNIVSYNILLNSAVGNKRISLMKDLYEEMMDEGIGFDLITISCYIKGLLQNSEIGEALKCFESLKTQKNIKVDEILYNIMMHGLVINGMNERAIRLFLEMESEGLIPSNVSFSILVRAETNQKNLQQVYEVLNKMRKRKIQMGKIVYTCLIQAFIKFREIKMALNLYKTMCEENIQTDSILFQILLYGLISHNDAFNTALIMNDYLTNERTINEEILLKALELICNILEFEENEQKRELERLLLKICLKIKEKRLELNNSVLKKLVACLYKNDKKGFSEKLFKIENQTEIICK